MTPNHSAGFEQELRAAMAKDVAELGTPRIDLHAIRRRTATRRRVLIPAAVGLISLVVAGPIALAQSGIGLPKVVGEIVSDSQPETLPDMSQQPVGQAPQDGGSQAGSPAAQPKGEGQSGEASGAAPATECVSSLGPLPAAERTALLRDVTGVVRSTQGTVAGALGKIETVSFAANTADRLLPQVGSVVRLVTCGDEVKLAAAERTTILGHVRAVLNSTSVVAAGVLHQTVGELDLGVATPVAVAVVSRTDKFVVLSASLGGGVIADLGTITVVVQLDGTVTKVDLSGLDLRDLTKGGLVGSLPLAGHLLEKLDLHVGLNALGDLAGVRSLVPNPSGLLAKDVTIVPPANL
jgi:hypothetical protein